MSWDSGRRRRDHCCSSRLSTGGRMSEGEIGGEGLTVGVLLEICELVWGEF